MIHNNNELIDDLQRNLSKLVDVIIYHPYIHALEKKQISKDRLEIFICEQFQILANDKKNFAFMISKTSNDTATKIFIDCLNAELTALENLMIFAEALDINRINLESYEPLSGCQAYTNYLTKLAAYGSDGEILAALLIDLPVWGNNCGKISYKISCIIRNCLCYAVDYDGSSYDNLVFYSLPNLKLYLIPCHISSIYS